MKNSIAARERARKARVTKSRSKHNPAMPNTQDYSNVPENCQPGGGPILKKCLRDFVREWARKSARKRGT